VVLADGNTERLDQEDSVEKERERESKQTSRAICKERLEKTWE
jgi:hypothetical protein